MTKERTTPQPFEDRIAAHTARVHADMLATQARAAEARAKPLSAGARVFRFIFYFVALLFCAWVASIWIPMMVQSGWFDVDAGTIIVLGMLGVLGIVCGISWVIGWHDRRNQ
jgi:predicted acyl esterase